MDEHPDTFACPAKAWRKSVLRQLATQQMLRRRIWEMFFSWVLLFTTVMVLLVVEVVLG